MASSHTDGDARVAAREMAESAREDTRHQPSFAAELFLGHLGSELVMPFPEQTEEERAAVEPVLRAIEQVLREEIDPGEVDRTGTIPQRALDRLHEAGAFRLKIPVAYGGLGFSQSNYGRAAAMVASWCGSTAILLSGHQSIGVPTPLKLFGTEAQKKAYLPRMASGELSAFALTEPEAGSDPARMETRAEPAPDGEGWILNGEKLWCTNGPIADVLIVMARTPDKIIKGRPRKQISAFIVESVWDGFETVHRCDFMGYGGIQSGLLRFKDMRIPKENLLWGEGQGLKLALITLNTGRLTLPATNTAVAKQCLRVVRKWSQAREQWGGPIGTQEAIAVQVGWIAAHAFAMEAFSDYAAGLVDRGGTDIRIEAAMAKLFCSETVFKIADRTMQIRAGRGFETSESLRERGETYTPPVERIFREARLNSIVEGTSEIMRLFIAREALDPHLGRLGPLAEPSATFGMKAKALLKAAGYYPLWYLKNCRPSIGAPAQVPAPLRSHWRRLRAGSRKLARRIFYALMFHREGLEHRQAVLGRMVEEAVDLTAMSLSISRAASVKAPGATALAELFCRHAWARIHARRAFTVRLDKASASVARDVLSDVYLPMENGILIRDGE